MKEGGKRERERTTEGVRSVRVRVRVGEGERGSCPIKNLRIQDICVMLSVILDKRLMLAKKRSHLAKKRPHLLGRGVPYDPVHGNVLKFNEVAYRWSVLLTFHKFYLI